MIPGQRMVISLVLTHLNDAKEASLHLHFSSLRSERFLFKALPREKRPRRNSGDAGIRKIL